MTGQHPTFLIGVASMSLLLPACQLTGGLTWPVGAAAPTQALAAADTYVPTLARRDRFGELVSVRSVGSVGQESTARQPATGGAGESPDCRETLPPLPVGRDDNPTGTSGSGGAVKSPARSLPPAESPPALTALWPGLTTAGRADPIWLSAVRAYAEGRADQAVEILKQLDPPNQELVLALLPALVEGATADWVRDPGAAAMLTEQFRSLARRLQVRAPLGVDNVTLCRWVSGFGRYEPWPDGRPYRPTDTAQLYLEVRNLGSRPSHGPHGETHLTAVHYTAEVRDAHGAVIEQPAPDDPRKKVRVVQLDRKVYSRGPVDDFHLLYTFPVPATPGVYTISLEVSDPATGRTARTRPVEFRVAGP